MNSYQIMPNPDDPRLSRAVPGTDHRGRNVVIAVPEERPLTIFLNGQEIVTVMTIGDYPEYLALGYLANQNMLAADDKVTSVDYDADVDTVVVRTPNETNFESKLRQKVVTSGCAQGTVFGDVMDSIEDAHLPEGAELRTSWLYALQKKINKQPSLYLKAGAIHGCVLCEEDRPLVYMEDVGRHNAIDKIAGWMRVNQVLAEGKFFYTTGRLTSEMVIKSVLMGIPIIVSRSGFTAWGVELARATGLTLIGRAKGKRFVCLSGAERLVYDANPDAVPTEATHIQRKGSFEPHG